MSNVTRLDELRKERSTWAARLKALRPGSRSISELISENAFFKIDDAKQRIADIDAVVEALNAGVITAENQSPDLN
jgi:hypothetical protein